MFGTTTSYEMFSKNNRLFAQHRQLFTFNVFTSETHCDYRQRRFLVVITRT